MFAANLSLKRLGFNYEKNYLKQRKYTVPTMKLSVTELLNVETQ